MSHFAVLVIGGDVEGQLARYDENLEVPEYMAEVVSDENKERFLKYYREKKGIEGKTFEELYEEYGEEWNNNAWRKDDEGVWCRYSTYNPDSKWDWYSIGGRWSGEFITKVFDEDHESIEIGQSGLLHSGVGIDSTIKGNIDFKGIREEAYKEAYERYKFVESCFTNGIPKIEYTWDDILNDKVLGDNNEPMTIEAKRNFYHGQKGKEEWSKTIGSYRDKDKNTYDKLVWLDIEDYQCTAEEFAQRAADNAFIPFAVVKDGEWYERGKMGWWAIVTDEKDKDEWTSFVNKMIDDADDETLFTFVDCHI